MSPHVAVVIVGYRNDGDIVRCLAALEKSAYRDFEVVICENGGDAAFDALRSRVPAALPQGQVVRLIKAPGNGGYASGVNLAMTGSRDADAWWILNPDTEPSPGAMAALIARASEGFDAVGGPIHFPSGEVQIFGGRWLGWQAKGVSIGIGSPKSMRPDTAAIEAKQNYIPGASMFVSRKFLQTAGPMAERYFLYCEEIDWFLRGRTKGMRLGFAPEAIVIHHQGTSTGYSRALKSRSCDAVFLDERSKMLLTWEFYPYRMPVSALLALFRLVARYGREAAFRQLVYGIAGWFMGLVGRSGIPRWAHERR